MPGSAEMRRARRADERGFAVIATLVVVVMILALGAIGLQSSNIGLKIASNHLHGNQALALAEGGVEHALALIVADADGFDDELASGGTGGALAGLGSAVSVQGQSYRFHQTSAAGDGYYVRVEDNYDEKVGADDPTVDTDQSFKVIARGRANGTERVVEVVVAGDPLFPYPIWTEVHIKISGAGLVDSYDSRDGPYVFPSSSSGNIYTNGFINLSSSTTVWGDASAASTVTTSGSAVVMGATTEYADPLTFATVAPCGPPYSAGAGISGIGTWSYDSVTGNLDGSGGASITLADGTYCVHDVVLTGGSTLTVNGPVQLSLTGKFDSSGGGVTNTTAVAANFLLFVSGGGTVKISGGGAAYMAVHARDSDVTFSGGSDFWGAIIANKLDNSGGTSMHYDEALSGLLADDGLRRILWREVKNR